MSGPEDAATHEAGHAVMAAIVGVPVRRVCLLPEGGGRTELGAVQPTVRGARQALAILAAGTVAEATVGPTRRTAGWWRL